MKDENLKKLPGYSWVDVDNKVHVFGAEDWRHPHKKDIDLKLDSLLGKIIEAGYVPDIESVPLDLDDDMKVKVLHRHSERMAIAYALIRLPIGKPIIVKKNITVCVDCHSAIKLISKVEGRKIILRDNSRFHHFIDGSCSCKDFCYPMASPVLVKVDSSASPRFNGSCCRQITYPLYNRQRAILKLGTKACGCNGLSYTLPVMQGSCRSWISNVYKEFHGIWNVVPEISNIELSVLVDRSVGELSIVYGTLELMFHRDLAFLILMLMDLHLQIQGKFYITIDPLGEGAKWCRSYGQEMYSPLLLAFTELDGNRTSNFQVSIFRNGFHLQSS
ncbi:hypothetical protein R6Q57_007988 [Mikania cordata]